MLKDFGASTILIGHSERRHIFSETDAMLAKKVSAVLKAGLSPLLCVGEKEDERLFGKTLDRITHQLEQGLSLVDTPESIVIAYEPVWAIGTGKVASAKDILQVHQFIRDWLVQKWGDSGVAVPLLYGGSVTAQNCKEIAAIENVNGFLIGGASLKVSSYLEIFQSV
jgi:triosephosphate isomerase